MDPPDLTKRTQPRLRTLLKPLYHKAFRAKLRLQCALLDVLESSRRENPPLPPARLRFRVSENPGAADFLAVGRAAADNIEASLTTLGAPFVDGQTVLDLGCGCARTLRFLVPRHPNLQWHGCDVDAEAIGWCQQNMPPVLCAANNPLPPLGFPADHFDVIYGVSVFTHIDEASQRAWLAELHRILKPGGWLLLTFYSEHVWRATEHAEAVARGEFVFATSAKLKGILPDWYQTALQSEERIVTAWSERFANVSYIPRRFGNQDLCAGMKPAHSR